MADESEWKEYVDSKAETFAETTMSFAHAAGIVRAEGNAEDPEIGNYIVMAYVAVMQKMMEAALECFQHHSVICVMNDVEETMDMPSHFTSHIHFDYQEAPEGHFCVDLD